MCWKAAKAWSTSMRLAVGVMTPLIVLATWLACAARKRLLDPAASA
jgi:hypothetical protein